MSLLLVLALLFVPIAPAVADDAPQPIAVERLEGADRYETSLHISKAGFLKSEYAVIASGESFPDALAGGQLAGYLDAPLLVTPKSTASDALFAELDRLGVTNVYLLGGTGTLEVTVQNALARKYTVERLEGTDRYATSKAIADKIAELGYGKGQAHYANGTNFPDALAAAPYVVSVDGIMQLVDGKTPIAGGVALGGGASVPGTPDNRIAGTDRYATAVAIAKAAKGEKQTVILVDGTNYPDALSASGYAKANGYSILLTVPKSIYDAKATADYLRDSGVERVIIIGGQNSVGLAVGEQIRKLREPAQEPLDPDKFFVFKVVDGDTIMVRRGETNERVRLIGVDTPESVHPDPSKNTECGEIASRFTRERLEQKYVELELDAQERDQYGRLLAYVWVDGVMFNKVLLQEGMAQVATYPPNVKYVDDFTALQAEARNANRGLWGMDCGVTTEPKPDPGTEAPKPNPGGYDPANPKDGLYDSPYPDRQIKGNIANDGEKIYHMPGQRDYKKTKIDESKGERWFATEAEAQAAGWRKAKR